MQEHRNDSAPVALTSSLTLFAGWPQSIPSPRFPSMDRRQTIVCATTVFTLPRDTISPAAHRATPSLKSADV
jgi:hypothetical protein